MSEEKNEEISQTVGEILAEKKNNFYKFLSSLEVNNINFNNFLIKLESISIDEFIYYISTQLINHKDNLDNYVQLNIEEYNIDINEEQKDKFKRYIDLFISLVI